MKYNTTLMCKYPTKGMDTICSYLVEHHAQCDLVNLTLQTDGENVYLPLQPQEKNPDSNENPFHPFKI